MVVIETVSHRRRPRQSACCRALTLSANPLSFLHRGASGHRHMLAPKRRHKVWRQPIQ